jgi:hypothetical protein
MKPRTSPNQKVVTLGLTTTPEIAAVIRRAGNLRGSISQVLWELIDEKRLARLMAADRERMAGAPLTPPETGRPELN